MSNARQLPVIEKLRLARAHPLGFYVGFLAGGLVPFITLTSKIAGERVSDNFYALALVGGAFSLMSLWSFGLGIFGNDSYGKTKAFAMCCIIEITWLVLPYQIPPDGSVPFHAPWEDKTSFAGTLVPVETQWLFLVAAGFCFIAAIAVNAIETAANMALSFETHTGESISPEEARQYTKILRFLRRNEQIPACTVHIERIDNSFFLTSKIHVNRQPKVGDIVSLKPWPHTQVIPIPVEPDARKKIEES